VETEQRELQLPPEVGEMESREASIFKGGPPRILTFLSMLSSRDKVVVNESFNTIHSCNVHEFPLKQRDGGKGQKLKRNEVRKYALACA
jgi:hypothetical protein